MWLFSFVLLGALLLFSVLFLGGILVFAIGKIRHDDRIAKIGTRIALSPVAIVVVLISYALFAELFKAKPDAGDVVGKYVMSADSNNYYEGTTLELFADGNFELIGNTGVGLCQAGKYDFNPKIESDGLTFHCLGTYESASIERNFGGFRIQFILGDPDGGDNTFFEKAGSGD